MPLAAGTRLGPYEITAPIGKGGMGEVYRARDTKLGRDVAIKVLPGEFANDDERLARFEREAKLLASLNHPNIASIYGFESNALVLELVEGPSLAERIFEGPIPVDEALAIAKQIAVALEAGHEAGIIHRDLKPANVKLKEDGTIKVLDYGLAKALEGDAAGGADSQLSQSPTLTRQGTLAGVILGTAAYMSPEQAKGRPVDRRTDIFAFGSVLYEMLAGKRAFGGDDVTDTLAAVLRAEPDFDSLPSETPGSVLRILRLCLTKDRKERARDIGDVRLALEGAFAAEAVAPPLTQSRGTFATGGIAGLLVGALLAGVAVWVTSSRPSAPAPMERVSLVMPANRPIFSRAGAPNRILALSPDGTDLVYLAARADLTEGQPTLALRSLATRDVRDLPGTEGARQPFFSPDGRWVAFFVVDGVLKKVALSGGNPITIADGINGSSWASGVWLEDGTIVFRDAATGLRRVSSDGGETAELTTVDTSSEETLHEFVALVPSTRAVLFTVYAPPSTRVEAVKLDTGERHVVVDNAWGPLVLNREYLLFQRQDTTLVAPFDVRSQTITGPAVAFAEDVQPDEPGRTTPLAQLSVSRDGTLAYIPVLGDLGSTLGLAGRDGTFEPLGPPPPASYPRVSPDGHAVAYIEYQGDETAVRIYDLDRGITNMVGDTGAIRGPAVWQPGGNSVAVGREDEDASGIFLHDADGSKRLLVPTPTGSYLLRNFAWSPDGKQLAYVIQKGDRHDIWIATLSGEPTFEPLPQSRASEQSPAFSPDGRWLAYVSYGSGREEVYVQPYPRGARFQASIDGGWSPVWRRDGKELFFAGFEAGRESMMAVTVEASVTPDGPSLELGKPVVLFDLRVTGPNGEPEVYDSGGNSGVGYDILPDGRFVMARYPDRSMSREIVLVRNWLNELERAVSTK